MDGRTALLHETPIPKPFTVRMLAFAALAVAHWL